MKILIPLPMVVNTISGKRSSVFCKDQADMLNGQLEQIEARILQLESVEK